jgi:TonB family protein
MKTTTYSGYSVWPDGLSVWPFRRRKWRWADLVSMSSGFSPQGNGLATVLAFKQGKPLTLQSARLFSRGSGPGRFAELIAHAAAASPDDAEIDDLTLEIAQWGPREVRKRLVEQPAAVADADRLVERARHHRIWLEPARALGAVEEALARDRGHPAALALRHQLHREQGKPKLARMAAQQWLEQQPNSPRARAALLELRLAADEAAAVPEAHELLVVQPDQPELAGALANYHFRAGNYKASAECWRRLGEGAGRRAHRQQAMEMAHYAERSGADPGFRRREKAKHWGRLALAWSGLIVFALVQAGGIYTRCTRDDREAARRQRQEAQQQEWAEQAKRRLEESDRRFTELTGRVMGNYAEVRERADKGEAAAQLTVAEMLHDGTKGAPRDAEAALEYLEKSAAQEHRAALLSLGESLVEGKRLPKDTPRAAQLFERAMELGSPRAAAELAALHQKGEGVARDATRARALYERAADEGYVYAMTMAGWMHERGEGGPVELARALDFYRLAAAKKNEWATKRLVQLLWRSTADRTTREEGWQWLRRGAQNEIVELQIQAAFAVLTGMRDDAEVEAVARTWLEQAAAKQESDARVQLAMCLMGGWGMEQDFTRAAELFASEEARNVQARVEWVKALAYGVGVARDVPRARKLLESLRDNPAHASLDRLVTAAEVEPVPGQIPRPIFRQAPQYPQRLRRLNIPGKAEVSFRISPEGFTEDVRIIQATLPEFGRAARLALSYWRFHPAPAHAQRTNKQLLEFTLDGEKGDSAATGN